MEKKLSVMCLAAAMPFKHFGPFIFVERPDGMFTLPGDVPGESEYPIGTAAQVAHRQIGLTVMGCDIRQMGELIRADEQIAVMATPYRPYLGVAGQSPRQGDAPGLVHQLYLSEALENPKVLPELKIIIPFIQAGLEGWRVIATGRPDSFVVTV